MEPARSDTAITAPAPRRRKRPDGPLDAACPRCRTRRTTSRVGTSDTRPSRFLSNGRAIGGRRGRSPSEYDEGGTLHLVILHLSGTRSSAVVRAKKEAAEARDEDSFARAPCDGRSN